MLLIIILSCFIVLPIPLAYLLSQYSNRIQLRLSDGIMDYTILSELHCPNCNIRMRIIDIWKPVMYNVCICEEYNDAHFHLECDNGREGNDNPGCGYKWKMRVY
jgi:hypothetical protein